MPYWTATLSVMNSENVCVSLLRFMTVKLAMTLWAVAVLACMSQFMPQPEPKASPMNE